MRYLIRNKLNQKGVALLLYLLIVILGSSYYLIGQLNRTALYDPDPVKNFSVLQEAKQALIAFAINNPDITSTASRRGRYGLLPCPDTNGTTEEGNQIGSCNSANVNAIGRLPWQSLGIAPLIDDSGECLWYAVSGSFKNNPNDVMLNTDNINTENMGSFEIIDHNGQVLAGGSNSEGKRVVAVIIAPGRLIQNQDRTTNALATNCGGNYDPTDYLDSDVGASVDNAALSASVNALDKFMTANDLKDDSFNDMVAYITAEEIFNAVNKRKDKFYEYTNADNLTRLVAECLAEYAVARNGDSGEYALPWPSPVALSDYTDSNEYNDYNYTSVTPNKNLSGRVPIIIDNSNTQISYNSLNSDNLIDDCSLGMSAGEKTELKNLWENWKDHLFYAVAEPYQPGDVGTVCGNGARCITINYDHTGTQTRDYSAVVMFSNSKLTTQSRLISPTDEKSVISNYIENITLTNNTDTYVDAVGDSTKRYDYNGTITQALNDILYCINDNDGSYDFDVCRCPTDANTTFNGATDCTLP